MRRYRLLCIIPQPSYKTEDWHSFLRFCSYTATCKHYVLLLERSPCARYLRTINMDSILLKLLLVEEYTFVFIGMKFRVCVYYLVIYKQKKRAFLRHARDVVGYTVRVGACAPCCVCCSTVSMTDWVSCPPSNERRGL